MNHFLSMIGILICTALSSPSYSENDCLADGRECSKINISDQDLDSLRAAVPKITTIRKLKQSGVNKSYKLETSSGEEYFAKFFIGAVEESFKRKGALIENLGAVHEAASSQLANYITGGLVPAGIPLKVRGIVYSFTNIDSEATDALFESRYPNFKFENIYYKLSSRQRSQVFVNMLADILLDNSDTHSGQFALTTHQKFVGFDKGLSYVVNVFDQGTIPLFSLHPERITDSKVYRDFAQTLKNNKRDLLEVLHSEPVQSSFFRIRSIKNQKKDLFLIMAPLFAFLEYAIPDKNHLEEMKESYFKLFTDIEPFIANFFEVDVKDLHFENKFKSMLGFEEKRTREYSIHFDPQDFNPRLLAPIEEQIPGDHVSNIIEKSGALAGTNAGFFGWGDLQRWSRSWAFGKIKQNILGMDSGNAVFPSAILKTNQGLFNDTPNHLAAIGWKNDGSKTAIGLLRVQWYAKTNDHPKKVNLIRERTPLNPKNPEKHLYLPIKNNEFQRLNIEGHTIVDVTILSGVNEDDVNSYSLEKPSDASLFLHLKTDDSLIIDYDWDEKEVSSTDGKGFLGVDQVVSGGAILIQDSKVNSNFDEEKNNPNGNANRVAVCVDKDGIWTMYVNLYQIKLHEFAKHLQSDACKDAINMDGGRSSTLFFSDTKTKFGNDIVVSDVISIMPRTGRSLSSLLYGHANLFTLLEHKDFTGIRNFTSEYSNSVSDRNINQQTPLQFVLKSHRPEEIDETLAEIIRYLISKMDRESLLLQDSYRETALHTALRNEHFQFVNSILDKLHFEDLKTKGLREQNILYLLTANPQFKADAKVLLKTTLSSELTQERASYIAKLLPLERDHRDIASLVAQKIENSDAKVRRAAISLVPTLLNQSSDPSKESLEICESALKKGLLDTDSSVVDTALEAIENIKTHNWFPKSIQDKLISLMANRQIQHDALRAYSKHLERGLGAQALEEYLSKILWEPNNADDFWVAVLKQLMNTLHFSVAENFTAQKPHLKTSDEGQCQELENRYLKVLYFLKMHKRIDGYPDDAVEMILKNLKATSQKKMMALEIALDAIESGTKKETVDAIANGLVPFLTFTSIDDWKETDKNFVLEALKTLKKAVAKGYAMDASIKIASVYCVEATWGLFSSISKEYLDLLDLLFKQGHGYDEAEKQIELVISSKGLEHLNNMEKNLLLLIEHNRFQLADKVIASEDKKETSSPFVLKILSHLVRKGRDIDRAKRIAAHFFSPTFSGAESYGATEVLIALASQGGENQTLVLKTLHDLFLNRSNLYPVLSALADSKLSVYKTPEGAEALNTLLLDLIKSSRAVSGLFYEFLKSDSQARIKFLGSLSDLVEKNPNIMSENQLFVDDILKYLFTEETQDLREIVPLLPVLAKYVHEVHRRQHQSDIWSRFYKWLYLAFSRTFFQVISESERKELFDAILYFIEDFRDHYDLKVPIEILEHEPHRLKWLLEIANQKIDKGTIGVMVESSTPARIYAYCYSFLLSTYYEYKRRRSGTKDSDFDKGNQITDEGLRLILEGLDIYYALAGLPLKDPMKTEVKEAFAPVDKKLYWIYHWSNYKIGGLLEKIRNILKEL